MRCRAGLILLFFFGILSKSLYSENTVSIENKFLKVIGDSKTGKFYVITREGNPEYKFDNNKKIIDNSASTFLTLNIDNFVFKYSEKSGRFLQPLYVDDNELKSIWANNNIKIFHTIKFIKTAFGNNKNSIRIIYRILNTSPLPRKIGARLLLDTAIGNNDIRHFRLLDNTIITHETEISKKRYPYFFWFGYKTLSDPEVFVYSRFEADKQPDKIIFASVAKIAKTLWDYKPDKKNDFRKEIITKPDSAVAIYWNPVKVKPGDYITLSVDYGILNTDFQHTENYNILIVNSKYIYNHKPANLLINFKNTSDTNINNLQIQLKNNDNLIFSHNKFYKKQIKKNYTFSFSSQIDITNSLKKIIPFNIEITDEVKNSKYTNTFTKKVINKKIAQIKTNLLTSLKKEIITTNKPVETKQSIKSNIVLTTNTPVTKSETNSEVQSTPVINENTNITAEYKSNTFEKSFLIYYIRQGDTLSEILAKILNINSWHRLKKYIDAVSEYNKIKNNNLIYPHNYIFIPCINITNDISINEFAEKYIGERKSKNIIRIISNNNSDGAVLKSGTVIILKDIQFLKSGKLHN